METISFGFNRHVFLKSYLIKKHSKLCGADLCMGEFMWGAAGRVENKKLCYVGRGRAERVEFLPGLSGFSLQHPAPFAIPIQTRQYRGCQLDRWIIYGQDFVN